MEQSPMSNHIIVEFVIFIITFKTKFMELIYKVHAFL